MSGCDTRAAASAESAFQRLVDDLLRHLDPRDRHILEMRFRDHLVQSQIAASVSLSQMQVSRIIRRAIEQLQRTAAS